MMPRINLWGLCILILAGGALLPGVGRAQSMRKSALAPGEIVVRYKSDMPLTAPRRGGPGRPTRHQADSLARLDRQFGLLEASRPTPQRQASGKKSAANVPSLRPAKWRVLRFPAGADTRAVAKLYDQDPNVAFAEPNQLGSLGYVPADPAYVGRQSAALDRMHFPAAWDLQQGEASVVVAVIDSGVDVNHPDLAAAIAPGGWDYVDSDATLVDTIGHGTRIAGIIAAAENGEGGVGAAFGCRILPFDVADARGQVRLSDVVAAIEEAVAQGAGVINLSLTFRYDSGLLREACEAAAESAVLVAAAGNDGQGDSPRYPASYACVLGVGATDGEGGCAIFSNFNGRYSNLIDVVAPGVKVYSPVPGGGWNGGPEASGTSFATPYVSAAVALLRLDEPEQSPLAIQKHLQKTAQGLPYFREKGAFWRHQFKRDKWGMGSFRDVDFASGRGLVDIEAALDTLMLPTLSVVDVTVNDDPSLSANNDGDGEMDQGETVALLVTLHAEDADARNLTLSATTSDGRVLLIDAGTTGTEIVREGIGFPIESSRQVTLNDIVVAESAGRGDVSFTISSTMNSHALTDVDFDVSIENKIQVQGPQPDIHFTNQFSYEVEDDLTLSGSCLIDPGTPFLVHPGKRITLQPGTDLTAVGTDEEPIHFRSLYDIPDLSLVTEPTGPVAGLSDPHAILGGLSLEEFKAQCGPKNEPVPYNDYQHLRYVSANTGSDVSGSGTQSAPWRTIQYALDQIGAAASANRYALLVAEGTYSNTAATTGTPVVVMKEWVDMWGGFEVLGWTRDIETHESVIDGVGPNAHRCVIGADHARIDGFTVTGGNAPPWPHDPFNTSSGGGIYCLDSSPAITNCAVIDNWAEESNGGGVACRTSTQLTSCSPAITNCTISGNASKGGAGGGGVFSMDALPVITNCAITENVAISGGGIYAMDGSMTIKNCIISGNRSTISVVAAGTGGGGIHIEFGALAMTDCVVTGNRSKGVGGGMSCFLETDLTLGNCVITKNLAYQGAGICCVESSPLIASCAITENVAEHWAGGVFCDTFSTATITNCAITGNSGRTGGGVFSKGSSPTITNSVISANSSFFADGVRVIDESFMVIANCAIIENAHNDSTAVLCNPEGYLAILGSILRNPGNEIAGNTTFVSMSNIEDGWSGAGSGNVDLAPQFVGVIASGSVTAMNFDDPTSPLQTTLNVTGTGLTDRDLTGWVVQVGDDMTSPAVCVYLPIASHTTNTITVWGDARTNAAGYTISAPTNWQVYDYHLRPDSPMIGLGLGPDDQTTTYSQLVSRFDGDGQPRFGEKCEIGPDEIEYETDFPSSVWDVFDIQAGATVEMGHVRFENGSGVVLNGTATGGLDHVTFFQQNGAGLDASGGTLASVTNSDATANWGPGMIAPNADVSDAAFDRNKGTGLTAFSAADSEANDNIGTGFDLTGDATNLTADANTTHGIVAANITNSIATNNGGWGVIGDALNVDAQNNTQGGIQGSAEKSVAAGNGGPGIMNGNQAIRVEVRDNAGDGIQNVAFVEDATISGNSGAGVSGATQITNSTISDNTGPGVVGGTLFDTTLQSNTGAGAETPTRLSHCTVARNGGDGVSGAGAGSTVSNSLISKNTGDGVSDIASLNQSNILGNFGLAATDSTGSGVSDFTGNYWGAIDTAELNANPENSNLSFIQDARDGSGGATLDVWPYATETVPEAPRAGGPPWAWKVTPDLTDVTTLGPTTFTITYTASMNTDIDPSVTFGLEDPYHLRVVEPNPGWISPTTWQGVYDVSTHTGDGIHTLRISGAMAADGFPIGDDTSHQFYINTRDPLVANNGLATALGSNGIRCTWDGPTVDGALRQADQAGYHVLMAKDDPDLMTRANSSVVTATQFDKTGLEPESLYFFRVQRVEADGTTEDWTALLFAYTESETPPTPIPMGLDLTVYDLETQEPLEGAAVTLHAETAASGATAPDGSIHLDVSAMPNALTSVTVSHADYQTATRQYASAAALTDEILLAPNPPVTRTVTIYGTVRDALTSAGVSAATIRAEGAETVVVTSGAAGDYTLDVDVEPEGNLVVSAEASGERVDAMLLTVNESSAQVNFSVRQYTGLEMATIQDYRICERDVLVIEPVVTGDAGSTLTFSLGGKRPGMELNADTGRLYWQTRDGDAGTHDLILYADSSDGRRAFQRFQVVVTEFIPSEARRWMLYE